mgnify:CR=1 FL=1
MFQNIEYCKQKKLCFKFRKKLLSFSNDWLYKRPTLKTMITGSGDEKVLQKMEVCVCARHSSVIPHKLTAAVLT